MLSGCAESRISAGPDTSWTHAVVEWYPRDLKRLLWISPQQWGEKILKGFGQTLRRGVISGTEWKFIVVNDVEKRTGPIWE